MQIKNDSEPTFREECAFLLWWGALIGAFLLAVWNGASAVREAHRYKFVKDIPQFYADHLNPDGEQYPFVAVTGRVAGRCLLGDNKFLCVGDYLQVTRVKEVYAWVETTDDGLYFYKKQWQSGFITPTCRFNKPKGHENPNLNTECVTQSVPAFSVGRYCVSSDNVKFPPSQRLLLTLQNVSVKPPHVIVGNTIYSRRGADSSPCVGDERTSYKVVVGEGRLATMFGRIKNGLIVEGALPSVCGDAQTAVLKDLFWGSCQDAYLTMNGLYWESCLWAFLGMLVVVFLVFVRPFSERLIHIFWLGALPVLLAKIFLTLCGAFLFFAAAYFLFLFDISPVLGGVAIFALIGVLVLLVAKEHKTYSAAIKLDLPDMK